MSESLHIEPRPARSPEERGHARYEGRLEASLWLDGAAWRCWIRDISLGGAGLEPPMPAALGKRVTLSSPLFGFADELPGHVVNLAHQRTCLAFELDEAARDRLSRFLAANT